MDHRFENTMNIPGNTTDNEPPIVPNEQSATVVPFQSPSRSHHPASQNRTVSARLQESGENSSQPAIQQTTIKLLSRVVQMQNAIAWEHTQRVYILSRAMGKAIGATPDQQFELEVAALLHDIGLISVPKYILQKPYDTLSAEEKAIYQSHTLQGEQLLAMLPELGTSADEILHHHELYNGSGYPDHLAGDEIPLASQIIAITDVYDELRHPIACQMGNSKEDALSLLKLDSGRAYHPELMGEFAELIRFQHSPTGMLQKTLQQGDEHGWSTYFDQIKILSYQKDASRGPLLYDFDSEPAAERQPDSGNHNESRAESNVPLWKPPSAVQSGRGHWRHSAPKEIPIDHVSAGMVLAQDLCTRQGTKLLPKDTIITQSFLSTVKSFAGSGNIQPSIYVYEQTYGSRA